ncbi:hypothetical protein EJV47_21745 [Hymenobacter gummosus]|uniref:Lipoprotein n=1 Tax=Hymenobacter gummosus TaxID=1776032 RepID=A0A431TXM1_9BACT|nr:hypothetical protein [Hymenobacter gummosus]RTQ46575.1 hypothetical protein EJV47_21745 [Hymenobacter gummosus]
MKHNYCLTLLMLIGISSSLTNCQTSTGVFDKSVAGSRAGIVRATKFESKKGTLFWSHFDATKRSSIISTDSSGRTFVLAEVTPDAAVQKTLDLLSKAKVTDNVDAEAQLKTASTIAQLGQRTANVNMLRDALYRIAEGANNNPDAFYRCGCPSDGDKASTPPSPAQTTSNDTIKKSNTTQTKTTTSTKPGKANTTQTTSSESTEKSSTTQTVSTKAGATSASTMYERLFQATLATYAAAVKSEADAEIEKAKAEVEKAKLEAAAKKDKDKPIDTASTTKPVVVKDSITTEVTLKIDLNAKTAPVKKKIPETKAKIKK